MGLIFTEDGNKSPPTLEDDESTCLVHPKQHNHYELDEFSQRNLVAYIRSVLRYRKAQDFFVSCSITFTAAFLAVTLRSHLAFVCSLVGSVTTTFNSIVLPILLFHSLSETRIPIWRYITHFLILCLALLISITGISASLCSFFGYASPLYNDTDSYRAQFCSLMCPKNV